MAQKVRKLVGVLSKFPLVLKTLTLKSIIYWKKILKEVFLISAKPNMVPLPPKIYLLFAHKFFTLTPGISWIPWSEARAYIYNGYGSQKALEVT